MYISFLGTCRSMQRALADIYLLYKLELFGNQVGYISIFIRVVRRRLKHCCLRPDSNLCHGPLNHGLATPFISYRVILWILAKHVIYSRSHHLAIVQTRSSPSMLVFVNKFVKFVTILVEHVFFWVIIILQRRLDGWVGWNNRLKRAPRGSCCWIYFFPDRGLMISKTTTIYIYKPMRSNRNNAIRKCTEITDYRRSTEWLYFPIRTVYALRLLGKIVFVIVLPISGSCQSIVYRSESIYL